MKLTDSMAKWEGTGRQGRTLSCLCLGPAMVTLTQKIPRDPNPSDCLALRRDPDPAVPSPAAHGPPVGSEALQYAAPAEIASRDNAARFVRVVLFVTFLVTMACA